MSENYVKAIEIKDINGEQFMLVPMSSVFPPGYRIVPERDVLTPEMRQAVRWANNVLGTVDREYDVTELFQDAHNSFPATDGGNVERHIETLRAIAQGGYDGE